jgi:hypothetical protein
MRRGCIISRVLTHETSDFPSCFGITRSDQSWVSTAARGSRVTSVRCDTGQVAGSDQQIVAGPLRPDGYIVRVRPAIPFALTPLPVSRSGFSAGSWRSVHVAGPARKDAEQAEYV